MSPNELLISLLSDAYATEMKVIHTLEQHIEDLERYPELKIATQKHLETSRGHASMVERCLQRLGSDSSALKVSIGEASGFLQSVSRATSTDPILFNLMNDYAAEHFEMSLYNVLIATAQELGDVETAETCRTILADEVEMARLINDSIPELMRQFVQNLGQ